MCVCVYSALPILLLRACHFELVYCNRWLFKFSYIHSGFKILHINSVFSDVMAVTKAEKFLFGVFRSVRKVPEKLPFAAPPLECASDDQAKLSSKLGDCETVDMEVDMIGGKNVGRVDVVVRKKISFGFIKKNVSLFSKIRSLKQSHCSLNIIRLFTDS